MPTLPEFVPKWPFQVVTSKPVATLTPSATTGNITLTASAGVFTSEHLSQYVEGNFGRARIMGITSATVVKARVIVPFFDTTVIASQAWTLETGHEDIWSTTRGWPLSCAFYQNRLVFGGSRDLPNSIALSRIGDYYDFDPGQALDDDAIFYILGARDEVPAIYHLMADRHLQIFTSSAEYYVPISEDTPLTPVNFSVRRTTKRGLRREIRPVNLDGQTVFCQQGGKAFREFTFTGSIGADAYESTNLSLHWSHLVSTPVAVSLWPSQEKDDADRLLSVNADGAMAVCMRMREQELNGAVQWTTDGLYKGAGAVDDEVYIVVDRVIGGVTKRYLEFLDDTLYLDSALTYNTPGQTVLTGLDHLEGKTVRVRADDFWQASKVVTGGQITLDDAIVANCQVGLDYTPLAETLPPWKEGADGPIILDGKTRISRVDVSCYETQNLLVQGDFVDFRSFNDPADAPIPEFTGTKIVSGLLGWRRDNKVVLTQDAPAPMTVRNIEYQVRG